MSGDDADEIEKLREEYHGLIAPLVTPIKTAWQQAMHSLVNKPPAIPIAGWTGLQKMVGGFRMNEFTILCGATGTGKTSLLANLSASFLKQGIKHFVASVETGHVDFALRVASVLLDEDINTGEEYKQEQAKKWDEQLAFVMNTDLLQLSTADDRVRNDLLVAKLRFAREELGCKIAMLDNLNFFMEVGATENQVIEMDRVVHDLIMFCKKTDMHVIMVMHPKKTQNGRVDSEFDIKGSSTAVQEAHNIFLFNRIKSELIDTKIDEGSYDESKKNKFNKNARELTIAKLRRRGANTGGVVLFNGDSPRYREMKIQ